MIRTRRDVRAPADIWPGFVDALSTLLLVIIFLLVVFVLGQFFLSQVLETRDDDVARLEVELDALSRDLETERARSSELQRTITSLSNDLLLAQAEARDSETAIDELRIDRELLEERLALLTEDQMLLQTTLQEMQLQDDTRVQSLSDIENQLARARETIAADQATIELQLAELIQLRRDIEALRAVRAELEQSLADATGREQTLRDRSAVLEAELADAQDATVLAQREIEERDIRIEELLRSAAAQDEQLSLAESENSEILAQAQELIRQVNALRVQLVRLDETLVTKQQEIDEQNETIADLGQRLNEALADRVEELEQFKSDFFGRVRQVLGRLDEVRIVGDRFVFQSELLFASGSAELGEAGKVELAKLSDTLIEIASAIPDELPWVLQVDGHTDKRPISTFRFPSNWELSTARAISVAQFFTAQGIPPERVAARGFAEFQPLDPGDSEAAFRRNRRIEIKLTTR